MTNIKTLIAARKLSIAAAQESKATSSGFSKGKHYCSALIRAFVTTRTGKTYSNESNCDYYTVLKISTAENGDIVCSDVAGYCQHSALVAREEKAPSAKAGAAEGARLANADCEAVAYEWIVFSSDKQEHETSEEKARRIAAAHKVAIANFEKMLNAPAPQEQAPAPQESAPTPETAPARKGRKGRK